MKIKGWFAPAALLLLLMITACGGLRYSQVAPEAKDFRPKKIGILPADLGTYEEARGIIDEVIAGDLVRRKWFEEVVAADSVRRQLQSNDEFRKAVAEYLGKLKMVNYSDPELSRKLGEAMRVDAFLVVHLDYWQYTMENKERLARVGMGVKMIDAGTGTILWRAAHHETETYRWVKPELVHVARKLVSLMMDEMPH